MTPALWARVRQTLLSFCIGGVTCGCVNGSEVRKPPFALPFDVSRAEQSVASEFEIRDEAVYGFNLAYLFKEDDPLDRRRVVESVGASRKDPNTGQWVTPGAPLVIRLQVVELRDVQGDRVVYEGTTTQPEPFAVGARDFSVRLHAIKLQPGRFKATVTSIKDAPSLKDVQTEFRVVRAYMGK